MVDKSFEHRLRQGQRLGEEPVLAWLGRRYSVCPATAEQQKQGADISVTVLHPVRYVPMRTFIEVKTQTRAHRAFFVETEKADGSAGWIYTAQAELIALVQPSVGFVVMMLTGELRACIGEFVALYGEVDISPDAQASARGIWVNWDHLESLGHLGWLAREPLRLENILGFPQAPARHQNDQARPRETFEPIDVCGLCGVDFGPNGPLVQEGVRVCGSCTYPGTEP